MQSNDNFLCFAKHLILGSLSNSEQYTKSDLHVNLFIKCDTQNYSIVYNNQIICMKMVFSSDQEFKKIR